VESLERLSSEGLEEYDRESSLELVEMSAIKFFSSTPAQASAATGPKKRVHIPHGKSERTIRRHKKAKRDLEAQGFFSLSEFFKRKAETAERQETAEHQDNPPGKECEKHEDKANKTHNAETEVLERVCSAEDCTAAIPVEEEEEEEEVMGIDLISMHRLEGLEEEEEEEEEPQGETEKTKDKINETHPAGDADASDGESLASSCGSDTTESDLEDTNAGAREPEGVHSGDIPIDNTTQQLMASVTDLLRDRARLQGAQEELAVKARLGGLDSVLRGRVVAMIGLLNLFLVEKLGYTWKKASEVIARSEGRGTSRARSIRQWVVKFLCTRELPGHQHGHTRLSVLNDENIAHQIKEALGEKAKKGFLSATDVMEVVSSPEIQAQLSQAGIYRPSIAKSTVC
jgi:hypothetical protein